MNNNQVPPQNLDAERSVVGGILIENDTLAKVQEILSPEDFYLESHRKIFKVMGVLRERGEPADVITLTDFLNVTGELQAVGGTAHLASLADSTPTAANIAHYATIVKAHSQRRQMITILRDGIESAHSSTEDLPAVVGDLASKLLSLHADRSQGFHIADVLPGCLKDIEKAYETKGRIVGVPTGLAEFEKTFGGISRGDLVVVGGRTSMGKTSFATTIAKNCAEAGYPVAFVSAESPVKKIVTRLLSQASGVENVRLQHGILRDPDFGKLAAGAVRLAKLPMWFLGGARSWEKIKAWLRAVNLREPSLALIVIDYAQLLDAPTQENKRYLEVTKISGDAKGLALELNTAVLLLSQLSRDPEKQANKRPKLSDLRESGSLEQDADIVFLLYRPHYYDKSQPRDVCELDIAKNRDGRTDMIKIRFNEETLTFSDRE